MKYQETTLACARLRVVAGEVLPVDVAGVGRSRHVLAVVLDGHVVFARSHWHIGDFVTVIYLVTAQIHFAWTIHCNG